LSLKRLINGFKEKVKKRVFKMFIGVDIEVIKDIKKRLGRELKDQDLPFQRREEVLSYLYFIEGWIKEKE
jgi:hypothetical protein